MPATKRTLLRQNIHFILCASGWLVRVKHDLSTRIVPGRKAIAPEARAFQLLSPITGACRAGQTCVAPYSWLGKPIRRARSLYLGSERRGSNIGFTERDTRPPSRSSNAFSSQ